MPVQPGKTYYFITHAYHHVIATVVAITGKREADVRRVSWIYRSQRSWTEFFRDGAGGKEVTTSHPFPDGGVTWINYFGWPHSTPDYEDE